MLNHNNKRVMDDNYVSLTFPVEFAVHIHIKKNRKKKKKILIYFHKNNNKFEIYSKNQHEILYGSKMFKNPKIKILSGYSITKPHR
jgi:hypothetical protein